MRKVRPKTYLQSRSDDPGDQERRVADRLGGKRVRGSGASMYSKGDVREVSAVCEGDEVGFLIECKQTKHASISIKWKWLEKITREASAVQKEPALAIEIQGGTDERSMMPSGCEKEWIAVPMTVFERLIKR